MALYITRHAIERAAERGLPKPTLFKAWLARTFGKRVGGRGPSFSLSGVTYVFTPDMGTLKTVFPN
ncbi:MAG: hypothetical protein IKE42_28535 [Aquamicrobium sp.]|nr:hypothetical protein [Aquamicrobium sp.]